MMKNTKNKKRETRDLILDRDASVLRQTALPVDPEKIGSQKIQSVLSLMKKALHGEDDGVAIAAPQVGESLRIFIVKSDALALAKGVSEADPKKESRDLVFINPEIIKVSKKKKEMEEGCLSVRWLYGEVQRHEKVTITAYDESGKLSTYGAGGLIAQIFQHEIDHLNGILFVDKAKNIRDLPPQNEQNG